MINKTFFSNFVFCTNIPLYHTSVKAFDESSVILSLI